MLLSPFPERKATSSGRGLKIIEGKVIMTNSKVPVARRPWISLSGMGFLFLVLDNIA